VGLDEQHAGPLVADGTTDHRALEKSESAAIHRSASLQLKHARFRFKSEVSQNG